MGRPKANNKHNGKKTTKIEEIGIPVGLVKEREPTVWWHP